MTHFRTEVSIKVLFTDAGISELQKSLLCHLLSLFVAFSLRALQSFNEVANEGAKIPAGLN